jgi:hypothetical protein
MISEAGGTIIRFRSTTITRITAATEAHTNTNISACK